MEKLDWELAEWKRESNKKTILAVTDDNGDGLIEGGAREAAQK